MTCIATSIACWYHHELAFFGLLLSSSLIAAYFYPKTIFASSCALLFAWQINQNIQTRIAEFNAHHEFLQTPVSLQATIGQKNLNFLHKDQAMLLLSNVRIEKSDHQKIFLTKNIMLLLPAPRAESFQPGYKITIDKITLAQPESTSDFFPYMLKENIWATTFVSYQKIKILNKKQSLMCQCYAKFYLLLHPENMQLFDPLFLGKREKNINALTIQHQSTYWGIAHHMARSGIHLVTLFGLFMGIFHLMRIRHFYRYLACTLLALFYFHISIANISFTRALLMILIQMFARLHQFNYSSIHALTLTTLIIVMCNPFCIFFLDFQLSFGITAVIIWLFTRKWAKTVVLPQRNPLPL